MQAGAAADLPPPGPVADALKAVQRRQPGSPRGKQEDVWSLEDAAEMGAACSSSEKELGRRCGRWGAGGCMHGVLLLWVGCCNVMLPKRATCMGHAVLVCRRMRAERAMLGTVQSPRHATLLHVTSRRLAL